MPYFLFIENEEFKTSMVLPFWKLEDIIYVIATSWLPWPDSTVVTIVER